MILSVFLISTFTNYDNLKITIVNKYSVNYGKYNRKRGIIPFIIK